MPAGITQSGRPPFKSRVVGADTFITGFTSTGLVMAGTAGDGLATGVTTGNVDCGVTIGGRAGRETTCGIAGPIGANGGVLKAWLAKYPNGGGKKAGLIFGAGIIPGGACGTGGPYSGGLLITAVEGGFLPAPKALAVILMGAVATFFMPLNIFLKKPKLSSTYMVYYRQYMWSLIFKARGLRFC